MGEFDHIAAALQATPIYAELVPMVESGDYSALETEARRHHYVPRFLLQGFSHDHGGAPHVFQMETHGRRAPRRVGLRSAAVREGLYTIVDENGVSSNRHEGWLALIERHAAPALRHLLDDPTALTDAQRMTVAFFIATQYMRTPSAAQLMIVIANAAFRVAASEHYSDRAAFTETYKARFGQDATEEEIEAFRQECLGQVRDGQIRVTTQAGGAFAQALRYAAEQVPILYSFDWILLRAPDGGLVTSDRGIAINDPTPPYPWSAQGLLSSSHSEVTVPLSDTACLALRPDNPLEPALFVQDIDAAGVEEINLRTLSWAGRHVFGKTQRGLEAVKEIARRAPNRVVPPRTFCMVRGFEVDPADDSLARRNERLGYPPHLVDGRGIEHDYIVIPIDSTDSALYALADETAERRARKKAGLSDGDPLEGRLVHEAIHPLDFELPGGGG